MIDNLLKNLDDSPGNKDGKKYTCRKGRYAENRHIPFGSMGRIQHGRIAQNILFRLFADLMEIVLDLMKGR